MWLWQPKNIHKRHLLWAKLFGLCLFFHFVFLFYTFIVYRDNAHIISLSLHKKIDLNSPIIFVPHGVSVKSVPITASKPVMQKNNTPTKSIKPAVTKIAPTTKNSPSATFATRNSTSTSQVIEKKTETVASKQDPITIEKKIETPIKKAAATQPKAEPVPQMVIPENAQICHNYRQTEDLRRAAQLQKELVKKWQVPPGLPINCACEISFFVTKKGNVQHISIIKSSGIMMYDISARQALYAMTMPTWTYGKQITINFAQ